MINDIRIKQNFQEGKFTYKEFLAKNNSVKIEQEFQSSSEFIDFLFENDMIEEASDFLDFLGKSQ